MIQLIAAFATLQLIAGCSAAGYYLGGVLDSQANPDVIYRRSVATSQDNLFIESRHLNSEVVVYARDGRTLAGQLASVDSTRGHITLLVGSSAQDVPAAQIDSIAAKRFSPYRKIGFFVGLACDITGTLWLLSRFATTEPAVIE